MFGKLLTRLGIRSRKGRETAYGYIFILPWLVGIVCFVLGPLVFSFITSFADYNMLTVDFIGLGNYKKMFFKDQLFWKSLGNTLVYSLLNAAGRGRGGSFPLSTTVRGTGRSATARTRCTCS